MKMLRFLIIVPLVLSVSGCSDGRRRVGDAATGVDADVDSSFPSGDVGMSDSAGGGDSGIDGLDAWPDASRPDGGCVGETHLCGGECASNNAPETCGTRCEPCDAQPNASATCEGSCSFVCDIGFIPCEGGCVSQSSGCGAIPLPTTCDASCAAAGECVDDRCVCTEGYRACAGGCCPWTEEDVRMREGENATMLKIALADDGTVFMGLRDDAGTWRLLEARPGQAIRPLVPTFPNSSRKSFELHALGPEHLVVATGRSAASQVVEVHDLHFAGPSAEPTVTTTELGSGYVSGGVGMTAEPDGTLWVSWAAERNRDLQVAEVDPSRTARRSRVSVGGSMEQVLVEQRPTSDDVFAFWGHRYTGSFVSGAESLTAGDPITTCPADFIAFRSDGTVASLFDTYSSIVTTACIGGENFVLRDQSYRGSALRSGLGGRGFALHPDGTLFVSFYYEQRVQWLASRDGERWARGELSERYREPTGRTNLVFTAMATNARGETVLVSVPFATDMGPLQVVRFGP